MKNNEKANSTSTKSSDTSTHPSSVMTINNVNADRGIDENLAAARGAFST